MKVFTPDGHIGLYLFSARPTEIVKGCPGYVISIEPAPQSRHVTGVPTGGSMGAVIKRFRPVERRPPWTPPLEPQQQQETLADPPSSASQANRTCDNSSPKPADIHIPAFACFPPDVKPSTLSTLGDADFVRQIFVACPPERVFPLCKQLSPGALPRPPPPPLLAPPNVEVPVAWSIAERQERRRLRRNEARRQRTLLRRQQQEMKEKHLHLATGQAEAEEIEIGGKGGHGYSSVCSSPLVIFPDAFGCPLSPARPAFPSSAFEPVPILQEIPGALAVFESDDDGMDEEGEDQRAL